MDSISNLSLQERKIVVGIDFGTTFSGVAWAETRRADHQAVIEQWPARVGTHEGWSSVKVPTEIRYTPGQIEWGFQIPPIIPRWHWFKLGLSGKGSGGTPGQNNPPGPYKSPEELTADYLNELVKHLMYTLEQKLGSAILRTIPLEFVLTVPAIWSDVAKEKTLRACQKAGLKSKSDIHLVSEPEAAAIYALHGLDPHGLNVGDSFVLCDAGGGTVDLISYTITGLYPILKVEEAAAGTGGLCGSTFLNHRFAQYLISKLGKQIEEEPEILAEAMERFDSVVKKQFSASASAAEGYSIPVHGLPNNESLGIRRGKMNVKAADMRGIFEPIVAEIIDLVRGQIRSTSRKIKAVLLVGGFGQSTYLKDRLRASLGTSIEVLQPVNAWTAVVRGAVMMGLAKADSQLASVSLVSRKARKHYGIQLSVEYDILHHDSSKKYWCEEDCMYRVRTFQWFIKKNDLVEERKPHLIGFRHEFLVSSGTPKSAQVTIYHDAEDETSPLYMNDNVGVLVTLVANLSHLTKADLVSTITRLADGRDYYRMVGSVEATYYSASTKYALLFRGKRYDTVTAEYV